MSQHDYDLANAAGSAFRADLNTALAAIVSQNSGATEPTTTYAYQWWADTTTGILKQRNAANSAWINIMTLATGSPLGTIANQSITVANSNTVEATSAASASGFMFRNRILNPEFKVDQRNAYAAQTITAGAALAYTADRWYAYCTGANVTGQVVAGASQSQKRYRFTGAASVTAIGLGTRLEAKDTYHLNNKTVTIAADLANSLLTSVTWTLYRATTTDDTFGTLAAPTVTQIASGTFTVNSTVTRYTTQVSVPAAATTGLQLVLSVGAQTSGTWTIGDVSLVEGANNSEPMERRPYQAELALCQRYCQAYSANALRMDFNAAATNYHASTVVGLPVTMRASPALSSLTYSYTNANSGSLSAQSAAHLSLYAVAAGAGNCIVTVSSSALLTSEL